MVTEIRLPPPTENEQRKRELEFRGGPGFSHRITGENLRLKSRFYPGDELAVVDGRAGRFTRQSVAGLIVGTVGVAAYALFLRKWLRQRAGLAERAAMGTES